MSWFKKKDDMVERAESISEVLDALGIDKWSQTGREIRGAVSLELLGERYTTMKRYATAGFMKSVDKETMQSVIESLREEGLLNKRGLAALEDKKK